MKSNEIEELKQDLKCQCIENGKKQEIINNLKRENKKLKDQLKELADKIEILEKIGKRGNK